MEGETVEDQPVDIGSQSKLLGKVIEPQVRKAGEPFLANLDAITVEQLCQEAERAHIDKHRVHRASAQLDCGSLSAATSFPILRALIARARISAGWPLLA